MGHATLHRVTAKTGERSVCPRITRNLHQSPTANCELNVSIRIYVRHAWVPETDRDLPTGPGDLHFVTSSCYQGAGDVGHPPVPIIAD